MTKNAEAEPWLVQHAFVSPPGFEFLKGGNSTIVYARSGAGKTAINRALEEYARDQLQCLTVRWAPDLSLAPGIPGTELARAQLSSILSACAHTILDLFSGASKKWPKNDNFNFINEFLHHFAPKRDRDGLTKKAPVSNPFIMNQEPMLEVIATELVVNLRQAGFPGGIWIMVDDLDWNTELQRQSVINIFSSLLSTLSFFDIPDFHFKMVMPIELEGELDDTAAMIKERITASRISWEPKQLRMIIERRLQLALGDDRIRADQIYTADELFAWLESCGGLSPRGWLEYFRPIFATVWENYASEGLRRLNKGEWIAARKRSSLRLRFYPESSQVVVGMNSPQMLSQEELAIFSYLYKNQGRYCSKREIYNKAYLPFNTKGQGKELGPQDELTKEFDDLVNTVIHRLRKTIEPLPKDPVFLTMKKNLGYRLSLQAFLD